MQHFSTHALEIIQQRHADLLAAVVQERLLRQAQASPIAEKWLPLQLTWQRLRSASGHLRLQARWQTALSMILVLCGLWLSTEVSFAQTVLTDSNGISGFELYTNGIYWWSAGGGCVGEFKHQSTIRVRGTLTAATKSLAADCTILDAETDNAVRDDAYLYFFTLGQLQRKALSAAESDPSEPLALAAPVLNGEGGTPLLLIEGNLTLGWRQP